MKIKYRFDRKYWLREDHDVEGNLLGSIDDEKYPPLLSKNDFNDHFNHNGCSDKKIKPNEYEVFCTCDDITLP